MTKFALPLMRAAIIIPLLHAAAQAAQPSQPPPTAQMRTFVSGLINKAVTITREGAVAGVLATSGVGITINAGTSDVINLRGLDIDGGNSGSTGIQFSSSQSLNIVANSTIANNAAGSQAQTASGILQVSQSTVTRAPPPTVIAKNIVTDFGARCDGIVNDNAAFTAFNTWGRAQTLPITLTIPTGGVCMFSSTRGSGSWFAMGIKKLLVMGYGATLSDNNGAGNGFFLGGRGVVQDNLHSSRVATVASGSATVTLVNAAESARFKVGNWALMAGLDLMGYGFPNNPAFFEYVKIIAVNSGTGAITFAAPLKNTYKATWPLYWAGSAFEADQGGPATLYALDPSWDTEVEYRGLTISQAGQTYANGRSITYRDVTFTGTACGIPTQNLVWQAINVNMSTCGMEADKLVGTVSFSGGTISSIAFQSSSIDLLQMTGTVVSHFINGTPKKALITGATIASLSPGATGYGRTDEVDCTTCVIGAISPIGVQDVTTTYTMSNGIISSNDSTNGPVRWAVPGTNMVFKGQYNFEGISFQVTDVTQDSGFTRVHTTLSGGFPSLPLRGGTALDLRAHPAPKFTCTNCTGSVDAVDLSGAPAGAPLWSYSKRTYTGNSAHTLAPVWGSLVSVKMNVSTTYTGSQPSINFNLDGPFVINSGGSAVFWYPMINPTIAGERDLFPSSVAGAQSGDSLSAPGTGTFLLNDQITPKLSADIGGENPSVWPTITIEIKTDQGVVNP
jgi:hypothetical protein